MLDVQLKFPIVYLVDAEGRETSPSQPPDSREERTVPTGVKRPRKTKLPIHSPMIEVAQWFRERRHAMGMTQTEFAAHTHLPVTLVSDLERGDQHIGLTSLLRAIEVTGGVLTVAPQGKRLDLSEIYDEEGS